MFLEKIGLFAVFTNVSNVFISFNILLYNTFILSTQIYLKKNKKN